MAPHMVPAAVSAFQTAIDIHSLDSLSRMPFACAVVIAVQTVKADLELRPPAGGTFDAINIFIPTGFLTNFLTFSS